MTQALTITTIDAHYVKRNIAALYMLSKNGHAAFIDTGTQYSPPHIINVMNEHAITKDKVDYVILTHIHLDHAGGASHMMNAFANAKLVVHPYGSRHMIDPSKLIAGTQAVYGEQKFNQLYGTLSAISADRVIESTDEMHLDFQGETLVLLDTPGHAKHHHCIHYPQDHACFTGDTLGICYPELSHGGQSLCLLPTTTPVQFSPAELHHSIDKVMSKAPQTLYPTHYGPIKPDTEIIARLHEHIDAYVLLAKQIQSSGGHDDITEKLTPKLLDYMTTHAINCNPTLSEATARRYLAMDAKLNSQGLAVWLKKYSK